MKKFYLSKKSIFLLVPLLALIFSGCLFKKTDNVINGKAEKDKRMDNIEARQLYEFNMLKNPTTGTIPEGSFEAERAQVKALYNQNLFNTPTILNSYTFAGPNNLGGRTRALAYDIRFDGSANRVIMAGGISGGVYKSIDDGATWVRKSPLGDLFSVSALAQDTRVGFRDTWYYAGGEFTGNSTSGVGASYRGKGVYKSTDNGETWTFLPTSNTGVLESFDHRADYVQKLVVDPTTGYVYMAALDIIYRSTDGGTTWSTVLTSGSAGFGTGMPTDIIVTATGRFYAAFAGGSNTAPTNMPGVWTSLTGASASWTKIAGAGAGSSPAGWNASGGYGRVVLAYAPSLSSRVFALYWNGISYTCGAPAPEAELYQWDDGISTWTDLSANLPDEAGCSQGNDPFAVQTGYDLVIEVKPDDPATIFIGGTNIYRSTSGFTTTAATTRIGGYAGTGGYALYTSSHPDIHAIAFRPGVPTTMLCGNDGGIQRTTANTAATVAWTQINTGYRTYQFYYVTLDPRIGNTKSLGGAQDNGSVRNISGVGTDFEMVTGGDGVSVGLTDLISGTQYEYVGSQNGTINRRASTTALGFINAAITPIGEGGTGLFVTLFKVDADNGENLYYANDNSLYRTSSASTVTSSTWTSMTGVASSVGGANDITALALTRGTYSAATASLFMGTSNAKVFRLDDPAGIAAATAPVDISAAGFPAGANVSSVAVNPRNDDTVLVTFSNYGVSGIWWTGNANSATPTWTAIESAGFSLPSMRSAAILVNSGVVEYYVGTSAGLFSTTAIAGASTVWTQEGVATLGNSVVTSMDVRPSDNTLLVGTHGYGMWKVTLSPPIPVTITSFTGRVEKKYNVLDWSVSTEINNKGYYIERKQKADNDFVSIGFVPGKGNSNINVNYSYADNTIDLSSDQTLYRLKQVDFDGRYKYSSVVILKRTASGKLVEYISADPNRLLIRMNGVISNMVQVRISDMNGKQLYRNEVAPVTQQIPIAHWPVGTYVVEIWNGNRREFVQKFIK